MQHMFERPAPAGGRTVCAQAPQSLLARGPYCVPASHATQPARRLHGSFSGWARVGGSRQAHKCDHLGSTWLGAITGAASSSPAATTQPEGGQAHPCMPCRQATHPPLDLDLVLGQPRLPGGPRLQQTSAHLQRGWCVRVVGWGCASERIAEPSRFSPSVSPGGRGSTGRSASQQSAPVRPPPPPAQRTHSRVVE